MKENKKTAPAGAWAGKPAAGAEVQARLEPPAPPVPAEAKSPKPVEAPLPPPPAEGYAGYLFPAAVEALGEIIAPYLSGEGHRHLLCTEVDTGGALIEMQLMGAVAPEHAGVELMLPVNMVRMIVSGRSEGAFGFNRKPAQS